MSKYGKHPLVAIEDAIDEVVDMSTIDDFEVGDRVICTGPTIVFQDAKGTVTEVWRIHKRVSVEMDVGDGEYKFPFPPQYLRLLDEDG